MILLRVTWEYHARFDFDTDDPRDTIRDGDTVRLRVDRGEDGSTHFWYRLRGVYCPEVPRSHISKWSPDDAGVRAYYFTLGWLSAVAQASDERDWPFLVQTHKPSAERTFDRYLADVLDRMTGQSLARAIILSGNGRPDPY